MRSNDGSPLGSPPGDLTILTMVFMGGLSDLDFGPGLELQYVICTRFSSSVSFSPSSSKSEFFLVASFGCSSIRLDANSVGLILQSCLGGIDVDYHVFHLSNWMYRFLVASKDVGLLIYRLKSYACKCFEIFFSLWGSSGPNWRKNYDDWIKEQEEEWTVFKSKSSKVKQQSCVKQLVFHRLNFPDSYFDHNFSDVHGGVPASQPRIQNSNPILKR